MSNGKTTHAPEEALRKENYPGSLLTEALCKETVEPQKDAYVSLLEDLPDLMCLFRPDGRITYANTAFCKYFGKKKRETMGSMVYSYIPRKDRKRFVHQLENLAPGKPLKRFEYRIAPLEGGMQWYQWTLKGMFDESAAPVDYILAGRNITSLKSMEEDLIEALDKYATLFESSKDAIILIDKYRFLDCNTAALKIFRCKDKETLFKELEKKVTERTGELTGINKLLSQEIQERKLIEESLRTSEERYRRKTEELDVVLNGITDIIMMLDSCLNIIWANEAASRALKLPREDLIGKKCYELWQCSSAPCDKCPAARAIITGLSQEETVKTKSGSFWQVMGYPVMNDHGTVRGAIEISRNVTDRIFQEKELQKQYKLDSLGTLAGGIAHDFNNILTVILGNVSFAKMLTDSEHRAYSKLDNIEKASLKAKDLTSQLLTFSKGGNPLKKKIHLDQLLRDTAHFVLEHSEVTARFHNSADLWPVEADESQIAQVIQNIILNAGQSMADGGTISIEAVNCTRSDDNPLPFLEGNHVRITVKDTGCGMDEAVLTNIFDPFFTTKKKNHGLGLATSYSIIRKHGGHITASSLPGKGTAITVYLPAVIEEKEEPCKETQETFPGKGRILFMDDESFIRDLAGSILSHLGYEVVFAREGNEAIREFEKGIQDGDVFDAVILDLTVVEGMGGKECIKELKRMNPGIKAIVSSGYSNDPIMSEPEKFGFTDFIAKPYNIQALSSVLRNTIQRDILT